MPYWMWPQSKPPQVQRRRYRFDCFGQMCSISRNVIHFSPVGDVCIMMRLVCFGRLAQWPLAVALTFQLDRGLQLIQWFSCSSVLLRGRRFSAFYSALYVVPLSQMMAFKCTLKDLLSHVELLDDVDLLPSM